MASRRKPRIGITIGDPCGVGPEIAVRAALDPRVLGRAAPVLIGEGEVVRWACDGVPGLAAADVEAALAPGGVLAGGAGAAPAGSAPRAPAGTLAPDVRRMTRGAAGAEAGRASYEAVCAGVRAAQRGAIDALATAPISKEAWHLAGVGYPGHTELLAEMTGATSFGMLFVGGPLRVLLATIHVPLASVPSLLSTDLLLGKLRLLRAALADWFGIAAPRIGVAGVNPHAGEHGLFGDEEERAVQPAVERARAEGIDARGPYPADVLFGEVVRRDALDAVLAMYHDQGLIPVKQVAFGGAVNVTIGLPFVRTSPDHGTAFDIAGRGVARAASLVAAIGLAADIVERRASRA
jgi:4-hydroxythreonine-4-phosphate dehydrogenase